MDFIEQHQGSDLPHPRDGAQAVEGVGIVRLGALDDGAFQVSEQLIIVGHQGHVDREALSHGGVSTALGDAIAVGLIGELLPDLGSVLLTGRLLDLSSERRPCAHQMEAAAQEIAGRSPRGRIDRGLGEHATAEQRRTLVGIDRVICGLTPVDSLHGEGRPQHAGEPLWGPEISQPRPSEEALDGHHQSVTIGRNGLEERFGSGLHVPVEQDLSRLVQDAEVHGAGRQVDTTIKLVRLGVESHEVSSS
jgi:hypothetical protein